MKSTAFYNLSPKGPIRKRPDPITIAFMFIILNNNFVVTNAIRGMTPGNLLSILAPILVPFFYRGAILGLYYRRLATVLVAGFSIIFLSIMGGVFQGWSLLPDLLYINTAEFAGVRVSVFTQSGYMLCALSFGVWVWTFYEKTWDSYLAASLWICLGYGFFLWLGFLITGRDLDFLANRTYVGIDADVNAVNQSTVVFGQTLMRFVSYPGEPSVFAYTMVPACWWAFNTSRTAFAVCSLIALLLSVSTTAYVGILAIGFLALLRKPTWRSSIVAVLILALIVAVAVSPELRDLINVQHIDKMLASAGEGGSGGERKGSFVYSWNAFMDSMPLVSMIFGIGFGSVRELSIFQTFLINIGVFGLSVFFGLYWLAIQRARPLAMNWPVVGAALLTLLTLLLAVPEFSYLLQWLWLGIIFSGRSSETFAKAALPSSSGAAETVLWSSARHGIRR